MKTYRAVAASLCMGLILAAGLARASECSETSARACQQIDIAIYEDDPERLELALDRWEDVAHTDSRCDLGRHLRRLVAGR